MTQLRMLNDNILVELPDEDKEKEVGGIVIPNFNMNKMRITKVLGVGNAVKHYRPGMNVILSKGSGYKVDVNGVQALVVKEKEVIGEKTNE